MNTMTAAEKIAQMNAEYDAMVAEARFHAEEPTAYWKAVEADEIEKARNAKADAW